MKILLVEDNPVDQYFVRSALRQVPGFAHDLVTCTSVAESLEHLSVASFDVILLDLTLPDCEGLETCRRVLADDHHVPVVVMTATDDVELSTEAIRSGAQDYLVKGAYPGSAIARVLKYAIDRAHFRSQLAERESQIKQTLSRVPAIIWTTNRDLEITGAMGAGLRTFQLDPQPLIGKSLEETLQILGCESDLALQAHRYALDGNPTGYESELRGRFLEVKLDPLREPLNGVVGVIGVAIDVTDRRKIDEEINFARLVQEALLPLAPPQLPGYDIAGRSCPAMRTCGDWFDYMTFADGSIGLVVADVSGKGFGPAILTATVTAYLEMIAESQVDVRETLDICNRLVCKKSLEEQFVVLALARLQAGQRSVTYAGAGEEMLIVGGDGLRQRVPPCGIPLGISEFSYAAPSEISLESGDILLLLTDGFREATNPMGRMFGNAGIVKTVMSHAGKSASEILEALQLAVFAFADGHPQHDDMTGIVVKLLDE